MRDRESGPGFTYERHSYYETDVRLQHNDFEIRFEGDETRYEESHVQRIYRLADIEQRIKASPFELVELLAEFTFNPGSEDADRDTLRPARTRRSDLIGDPPWTLTLRKPSTLYGAATASC